MKEERIIKDDFILDWLINGEDTEVLIEEVSDENWNR